MLRGALLLLAAACIAAGVLVWALGGGGHGLGALVFGVVLLFGLLFERWRYRGAGRADASWQKTGERFSDPKTGRVVEVFYDPQSGARRYLEADGTPYPPPDP